MSTRPILRPAAALLAAALLLTGCAGYDATVVPSAAPETSGSGGGDTTEPCENDGSQLASYAPRAEAANSADVEAIRARGRLVAGVAADTELLAARDARTGEIVGFDIDLVDAIAAAIFGVPQKQGSKYVELKVITAAERFTSLQEGSVDVVVRNTTINCTRWQLVAFSAEYYPAGQKVLVGTDAGIESIEDLADKRICAPSGTTSIENIQQIQPDAVPVTAGDNSECMIKFQAGEADGVSTDDTVLAGLAAQDPYAEVLDTEQLTAEPYGVGVNAQQTDLVRFVNGVLEDYVADGRWKQSYDTWLRPTLGVDVAPPTPVYGR
ncbi:MAG: transporter substrate-binding protein [Nocardioides sp.]|nr:transporter substrate-binding protein [Nocardioides sp.]